MRIYKISHAGFNLGDSSRRITDVIYEKIRSISYKATGGVNRTPTESELRKARFPLVAVLNLTSGDLLDIQDNVKVVPFLSKKDEHSLDSGKYDKILASRSNQSMKIFIEFSNKLNKINSEQKNIHFPASFYSGKNAFACTEIHIEVMFSSQIDNSWFYRGLADAVEHELQHYAQYISNVPWSLGSAEAGSQEYFNQLKELQAFASGVAMQLSDFAISSCFNRVDMKSMKSEEEALVLANSEITNFPELIMGLVKDMQLSPKNSRDYIQSVIRMTNKKIRESVHELFMASSGNYENI